MLINWITSQNTEEWFRFAEKTINKDKAEYRDYLHEENHTMKQIENETKIYSTCLHAFYLLWVDGDKNQSDNLISSNNESTLIEMFQNYKEQFLFMTGEIAGLHWIEYVSLYKYEEYRESFENKINEYWDSLNRVKGEIKKPNQTIEVLNNLQLQLESIPRHQDACKEALEIYRLILEEKKEEKALEKWIECGFEARQLFMQNVYLIKNLL